MSFESDLILVPLLQSPIFSKGGTMDGFFQSILEILKSGNGLPVKESGDILIKGLKKKQEEANKKLLDGCNALEKVDKGRGKSALEQQISQYVVIAIHDITALSNQLGDASPDTGVIWRKLDIWNLLLEIINTTLDNYRNMGESMGVDLIIQKFICTSTDSIVHPAIMYGEEKIL